MLSAANKNDHANVFDALIRDLKQPLVLIARQAELDSAGENRQRLKSMQKNAEKALRLIDTYLLVSQGEYGQQTLPLSSFGVGSVIYDIAEEMRPLARESNIELTLDIEDALVHTNPQSLRSTVWCLSDLVVSQTMAGQTAGVVEIKTKRYEDNIRISVLSKAMKIKNSDIEKAHRNIGKSRIPLNSAGSDSGIRLAIADLIGESMGTKLVAVKSKGAQGIGFELALGRQLQLV